MSDETFPRLHYPLPTDFPGASASCPALSKGSAIEGEYGISRGATPPIGALVMPSPSLLESRVQASYSELEPASNARLD